jgi:Fe2+ transport system protein B
MVYLISPHPKYHRPINMPILSQLWYKWKSLIKRFLTVLLGSLIYSPYALTSPLKAE